MPPGPSGGREREILTAIVETFIATGEPVGSRTLARGSREGLSAATIRNVMADLVDAGYLEQPHTSAGRVPTAEAYRYYVEQLSGEAHLSHENQSIIQDTLTGVTDVQEFMERTSHVLSLISHSVGVTVASSGPRNALEHVYFSRLGDQKVLAVLVTHSGVVRDRVLRLDIPQADLDLAARYINENFRGWTMDDMRAELARRGLHRGADLRDPANVGVAVSCRRRHDAVRIDLRRAIARTAFGRFTDPTGPHGVRAVGARRVLVLHGIPPASGLDRPAFSGHARAAAGARPGTTKA